MPEEMATKARGRLESPIPRRMALRPLYKKVNTKPRLQTTVYRTPQTIASVGRCRSRSCQRTVRQLNRVQNTEKPKRKVSSAPMVRLTARRSSRPTYWAMTICPAEAKPMAIMV